MDSHGSSAPIGAAQGPVGPSVASPRGVFWVRGEQDIATRSELSENLAHEIGHDVGDLVVDLSQVQFMDASTVGVIVGARNLLLERSEELTLRAPSSRARRVLDICDLAGLIGSDAPESEGPTSALSTWVQVPAADRGDVGPAPEPDASRPQIQRPPPVPSRPES